MAVNRASAAATVIDALRFDQPSTERLREVPDEQWDDLLDWCDRRQITFVLRTTCGDALPEHVRRRMDDSLGRYTLRFVRMEAELASVIDILDRRQIPLVVLKGATHAPEMTSDPLLRAQGDIDLWIPHGAVDRARAALEDAGYRPTGRSRSDRHLPPMMLPGAWRWRGDIFDPEMPVRIELHHDLWSDASEQIPIPGEDQFLDRLRRREIAGRQVLVLSSHDLCGFAALHLLLHLLHGDLPLQRAWEIAHFVHTRADHTEFWSEWREVHGRELRAAEAVVFEIVRGWFGSRLPECVREEVEGLPREIRRRLVRYGSGNYERIRLHLALIPSPAGRLRVVRRRLAPSRLLPAWSAPRG